LRRGLLPGRFLEQHIVGGVGIERWIQVDQVNTPHRDMFAENLKVITKIKLVLPILHACLPGLSIIVSKVSKKTKILLRISLCASQNEARDNSF
jgi:hypothetical protein